MAHIRALSYSSLLQFDSVDQAHPLQLEAFSVALKKLDARLPKPKLQFVGSCRNKSDEERLQNLKDKAVELKVDGNVEFHKNLMYRSEPTNSYSLNVYYQMQILVFFDELLNTCMLTSKT